MNLKLSSPFISTFSSSRFTRLLYASPIPTHAFLSFILRSSLRPNPFRTGASPGETRRQQQSFLYEDLLARVSAAQNADEALRIMADATQRKAGVVESSDCRLIISAALSRNNADLALSVFCAMWSSFDAGDMEKGKLIETWRWCRPDVDLYASLVLGLAASLRVSDALKIIHQICRVGVSPSEEVPFGKVVRCPMCMVAVGVAQPQQGIQFVSCAKCRYQYEMVSGNIVNVDSEEISMEIPAWKRGLKSLKIIKQSIPAAVHSIVVQMPSGRARTYRFSTETVDLPAQEGERVTIASAAPENLFREVGPFKFSPKSPNFYPGEPMCLTNHKDGRESPLLRAPANNRNASLINPSLLVPFLTLLAAGDAASGIIDPSLPQLLPVAALGLVAIGATLNTIVFPQLNQRFIKTKRCGMPATIMKMVEQLGTALPQRSVDAVGIKQQLLSQYYVIQSRIRELKEASEKEVWMLARMCQLEKKILVVGEPSYRARRGRIKRVQGGLETSLRGKIDLIDSFARIASMIEIEVEMDSDVLAAESIKNVESISEQIQQILELENLEEKWKIQAEANDEAERLLGSEPLP